MIRKPVLLDNAAPLLHSLNWGNTLAERWVMPPSLVMLGMWFCLVDLGRSNCFKVIGCWSRLLIGSVESSPVAHWEIIFPEINDCPLLMKLLDCKLSEGKFYVWLTSVFLIALCTNARLLNRLIMQNRKARRDIQENLHFFSPIHSKLSWRY